MEKRAKFSLWYFLLVFGLVFLLESMFFSAPAGRELSYGAFIQAVKSDSVQSVVIEQNKIYGLMKDSTSTAAAATQPEAGATPASGPPATPAQQQTGTATGRFTPKRLTPPWGLRLTQAGQQYQANRKRQFTVVRLDDPNLLTLLQAHHVDFRGKLQSHFFTNLLADWLLPLGLLVFIWIFFMRRMGGGQSALNIGKNKPKVYELDETHRVTFQDVAGIDEVIEEVKEVVEFLRAPGKFTKLGARLPKGVLLVGPPGTGKTLLARATAGEANVPFFHLSGSDFVEMFVGVGAARVRDLFTEAKKKAPCIIFIDELDAVGKKRGRNISTEGYDERENTLNQLLTEMDGFDPTSGIVIMAATNRPEVLDAALLRPGRFDRQILVDRPDLLGRIQIFKIHTRSLPLAGDTDLKLLASQTPGFVGADIAHVCNEASLLASRQGEETIHMHHFQAAIERVVAGLEKKNRLINPQERRIIAFHESGHAIVGHFSTGADPVHKVSIIPHGLGALGYTIQSPLEDRYLMTRKELLDKIKSLLGGRAAEEVVFGEISTGASNDLEKATHIARDMLTIYGMSKHAPNVSLGNQGQPNFLGNGFDHERHSDKVEQILDDEVLEIIDTCYEEAKHLLREKSRELITMANLLLEKENIDEPDIVSILGPRPREELAPLAAPFAVETAGDHTP